MTVDEQALAFVCTGEQLVGVLARPAAPAAIGVVVIVGGPQYRVGSHRQFVLLARRLAAAGITALRFDYRGMGDATGAMRTFEDSGPDIAAAIDALQARCPEVERVVLWGLCDAASGALLYCGAAGDPRVAGLALLNPWVRSEATHAKAELKHYYLQRLTDRSFWSKLGRGEVDVMGAARAVARGVRAAATTATSPGAAVAFQDRMADALRAFAGPVLLVLSEHDLTAREFADYAGSDARWRGLLEQVNVTRADIAGADHTFSTARWRDEVEACTLDWLAHALQAGSR
jgi:exosortase A-associated hydrolase 1